MDGNRKYLLLFFLVAALAFTASLLFGLLMDRDRHGRPAGNDMPAASKGSRPNVVVITIDTLRHDHLGCTGHEAVQTPNIDRLASEGVLFEQALSPAPTTLPSHASIFTGTYPFVHGARNNGNFRLSDENVTLAEVLREHGYETAAFVGSFVLDSQFGLDQGFDTYDDDMAGGSGERMFFYEERPAHLVTDAALTWLTKHGNKNFFVWLHYYDPHALYNPPPPFAAQYSHNPYDGEIAYTDSQIGMFIETLKVRELYDNSILVLTSDHGESLGEHGEATHGIFVYDSTLRVPLVMKLPPHLPGKIRIKTLVRLIDIMPTVLDMLDIHPDTENLGKSLLSILHGSGETDGERLSYCESFYPYYYYGWSELVGIRTGRWKYIEAPKPEFYDLQRDPLESTNLIDMDTDAANSLKAALKNMTLAHDKGNEKPTGELDISAETLEKLMRLGYFIRPSGSAPASGRAEAPDPKDRIKIAWDLDVAADHFISGRYDEALKLYEKILEDNPGNILVWMYTAFTCLNRDDLDGAMEAYRAALDASDNDRYVMAAMAGVLLDHGHIDESIKEYERAAKLFPEDGRILNSLGAAYLRTGRYDEAIPALKKARAVDPDLADACYNLGTAYIRTGKPDEAIAVLQEALTLSPNDPDILNNLGVGYGEMGMWKEAVEAYEKALAMNPDSVDANFNLGVILAGPGKNPTKARFHLHQVLKLDPDHPRAAAAKEALAGLGD